MAGISTFNINIKEITDVAERDIATKAVEGIKSPSVVSERGSISGLIDQLRASKSEEVKKIATQLGIELSKAVMSAIKSALPEIANSLTRILQTKKQVITPTKEQVPSLSQKKERIPLPSQTQTAAQRSLIDSSDVLMSQIQKDFINFKVKFAKSIRAQLTSSHGGAFKVIGKGAMPYTKRGGVEVLKIANIDMLIGALKMLTNVSEKQALAMVKKGGAGTLVTAASRGAMQQMSAGFGKTQAVQTQQSIAKITEYINKHGYEGLNEGITKIIRKQRPEGKGVTEQEIRKTLLERKEGAKKRTVSQEGLQDVLAETAGRSYVQQHIGAAISEVEIPRPQAGPQGLPSVKMQSGRHRALTEEYRFTPGIMVASERARQIKRAGVLPAEAQRAGAKVEKIAPELPRMILKDEKAALAEHSSNIMDVMKTDKKGRLELINAYRETVSAKVGKKPTQPIPEGKKAQLKYLDDLSNKAKKLSIGFDDVLVALGKLTKTGIYDRLLDTVTKEAVGVTSPMRTTVGGLATDPQAVKTFNKRIGEVFSGQELVEEGKPRLGWYQSKTAKLNVPKLTPGEVGEPGPGEERRQELVAYNRELEKFTAVKGKGYIGSQGIGESRAVEVAPDVVDKSRQRMNVFTESIRDFMPLGELSNFARTIAPTYQGLGGGRTAGGKIIGGLETPLLQSEKGRAAERAGVWGPPPEKGGGYGLNLQTEIRDTSGNFEDQIEIAGKAVNRFATYIKPKIKDVKDIGGAEVVAKDMVSTFAPEMGKALRMKEPGKAVEGTALVAEISKILTGPGGESLNTRAVKIVEKIFTQLGTKMTTAAGSKGVVTFGTGKEGELGYREMPTSPHELLSQMLEKRKGTGEVSDKRIAGLQGQLKTEGTKPFVSFMHKDLPKAVQKKYKEIRDSVGKILGMDLTVSPETISSIRSMAKTELGGKAMTKKVATEVRMSLTGATKRLNLMEPLEAVVNNITGNVKAISPKLTPEQRGPTGEVSQYLQAMGYGWGPEEKKPMKERTLPMYTGKGAEGVIAGQKFWQYPREPAAQEEWAGRDIETGRKGQKLNVAAMGALTSVFGEKSAMVQEAMGGFRPETGRALENIMGLRSLGEEPIQTKAPYIPTTGMKELPGVISKHEDLRDTILDARKFGAGGFAEVPEFEGGKEVGKKPLYIPSRESLGMYAEEGGAAGANKLATMYGSLLTNVGEYEKTKTREYPKGEKANVDTLRKNVKGQIGKTSSDFRKMLSSVTRGERSAISGEDLKNLINYFKKLQIILKEAAATKDPGLKAMKTAPGKLVESIGGGIADLETASKSKKGLDKSGAGKVTGLLMNVKDNLLEPKLDTKKIERIQTDLKKLKTGKPLTDISPESYYFHKKATETWKKKEFTSADFESDVPETGKKVRSWVSNSLNRYLETLTAGKGKPGLLSTSEGALGVAAKQFGVTTDPKEQALEERQKAIERDKFRLKKELTKSTIGRKKGVETLQTRTIPAISGTLSAAITTKVEDFKAATEIIKNLGAEGILGDTSGLVNALETQTKKHETAVEKERKADRVVLREGEVGLPAGKLEKLTGDYGIAGKNLLEATRAGKDIPVMTTRFPMTGLASHQFAKAREVTHPAGKDVISLPGAAPGIDVPAMESIIGQLKKRQGALREERAGLGEAKPGTAKSKELDAKRISLTKNILELSKAIDLVTVKFSGFAQNADIDGDTLMVHAGKTKAAQKEIAGVERARRTGVSGGVGVRDPRAFINQMMNYNIKKQTSSMAELAGLYTERAKLPAAKLFQTPEITKEMKGVSFGDVEKGLKKFNITLDDVSKIATKKGFTEPEQREPLAREMLYEKTRAAQYGKMYVKTGLGESTESISRVARFMEASVGFGEKQITKPEYAAWKPESAALGAVYGKGGALTQKARPGREMQTMMNVLLEQVINQAMSAKHGGKAAFQEVTQGMASGTLFKTMQEDVKLPKKDQRFKGILKANEIIKTVIRDRLDALNAVDFAAEAKRHKTKGKGRAGITDELVNQFSFEGFLGATAKDIQNQVLKTAKTPKQEAAIKKQIGKGELDLGMYFPQMQPEYALRTSSASIEKFAKQTKKGKTSLDKGITTVLRILKSTGTGVSVSDSMMSGAVENMFGSFKKAEKLGVNLEKIFAKSKSAKQKRRAVGGLERQLGMPTMPAIEQQMVKEEGAKLYREKRPEAGEKEIAKFQEEYLFGKRKRAIEQHVKATPAKKQLMMDIFPGMRRGRERIIPPKRPSVPKPERPLMLPPGYGYISEEDVPDIGVPPTTLRETLHGVKQGKKRPRKKTDIIGGLSTQEAKLAEAMAALRGGAKGKDYAALTESQTNEVVKTLKRYTEALNLLLENASNLTTTQTAKIQKALSFIKQNVGTLAAVPAGTKLGAVAKSAVSALGKVRAGGLEDFAARAGISTKVLPTTGVSAKELPLRGTERPARTRKYGTDLEALQGFVAAAKKRTGYSAEGKSEKIQELLGAVRGEPSTASQIVPELMKETFEEEKTGRLPREKGATVWSQYYLEKVRGELDKAMEAETAGSVYHRDEAVGRAKGYIRGGYESRVSPFLTRAEGGRGRVTGYADEEAASMLGLVRMPTAAADVGKRISKKSETAGAAVAPVLSGVGRMEERLKVMWARVRGFAPELAKAGKAFNFDNAQADLAIIKDELKGFKFFGDFSSEEAADIDHAISKVTKMQKAVQEAPEKALPALAIPELETTETAVAAFENQIAANVKEMEAQKDLAIGETRKVVAKIPTAEGQIEKRQVTLIARGAKEGIVAPGVVGGIERVEGKPTVMQKEWGPSRRSVRLLQEFSASTDGINKKIQQIWLGIKRFDKAADTVDFSEALEDLTSMQMLIAEMLKNPLVTPKQFGELSQLKRQIAPAARAIAGTPEEGLSGLIMKGMETPESAKAAFNKQIEAQKAAFLEREDLEIGQKISVAATLPTRRGVTQKKQVQLTAVGEGGVVTGVEEQEYKPAKQYLRELTETRRTRGAGLVKQFASGTGDTNARITKMLLGVKGFNVELAKTGKYSKAINFKNAEKNLVEIMALLNNVLKGAALLTEEERAAYKQAQLAAKAMYQKVVKTPVAARKGISMGGYETPESSLAAFRARLEEGKRILEKSNQIGRSMVIKGKLISESGEEVAISKKLTARGSRFLGLAGPVTRKSVKEREEAGGGQVGSVIRRVAMWGAASGVVYGIIGGAKQMIETMKNAETGLVNLKKVMSHVTTDFDHMRDSAVRFAKDYGAELMGVFETMRIFAQQGLPQDQVKEMARVSTLASNVTTMKPAEAAEALTSATRQFNIEGEKSISILDSWNEVENKFAITAKDLADGFKKAGTAAKITGIDVNKLNGIITAIGEATRQTGKEVGTSLKFIFSRMATEKAPRAMKAVGVKTMEGGRLREGSAILDDLAKRWVVLTRSQKLATAQAIGGIRHYNALMVLMDNYDRALAATAASINSVGSAEKENKMIMETYAKKVAQMKASFDALAVSASGPVLGALGKFADALKGIAEAMAIIPGGVLAGAGAGAYMGATALGKYFDLSMFGLLGSSVGGAPRKRKSPMAMLGSMFEGKEDIGRDVIARRSFGKVASTVELRKERSREAAMTSLGYTEADIRRKKTREPAISGVRGREAREAARASLGYAPIPTPVAKPAVKPILTRMLPTKRVPLMAAADIAGSAVINKRINSITKGVKGIAGPAKRAGLSLVGMLASLGTIPKILIPLAALGYAIYAFGSSMSKTFASAKDRTEDYRKSLDEIEERLTAIGDIKLLRTRIEISAERIKSLEALTPAQVASQVEGRSYKSPILMRKQQIESVKEYAGAVASMTSAGLIGFDSFGKAVVVVGNNLGGVVDSLEEIASKARVELKLYIEGERLEDLMQPPELDTWFERQKLRFREFIGSVGKAWGAGFMEDYAESKRNPFESLLHSVQEIDKLREKAGAKGRVISPPSLDLKETKPKQYKEQKKEYDEWTKAQQKRVVASKRMGEEFQNIHREFFTTAGPGMTTELAGKAAFGRTGGMLAQLERQRSSQFYDERGVSTEDIQASFMHRLRGVNVRASAELTREAAMEQGIPVITPSTEEGKRELLDESRAKDILMFEEGAGFLTNQVSVFERDGKLWVQYAEKIKTIEGEKVREVEKTLEEFKKLDNVAKNFVAVVSSMGMLMPVEARLREVSKVFVGAEAGMFKPQKDRTLELGKKYRYQASTEMLIQNDAYKKFSKPTTGFIGEYIKQQANLRSQQKAALSIYEKRGSISGETAANIQLLTTSLIKFSNTAIQSVRAVVELEKSLEQLEVGYEKQAAVQEFRSENLVHMTGPLAGKPLIRTPKIDIRKTSALSPHERLEGNEEYMKVVESYNEGMDRYNAVVKKGETAVQAAVDIEYVKGLAKEKPEYSIDVEEIAKGISKTGDLASGSMLAEMEKQTSLEQQTVDNLKTVVGLLSKGGSAGLELYEKAMGLEGGERASMMGRAATAMKTDLAGMFAQGNIQGMIDYDKDTKVLTEKAKVEDRDPGAAKYATAQFLVEMGSYADAIRKEAMIKSGVLLTGEIGKKPTEEQKTAYEAVEKKTATSEQERIVGEDQYSRLLDKGGMGAYLRRGVDKGLTGKIFNEMKDMFAEKTSSVEGEGKPNKVLADNILALEELGKKVEGEAADLIKQAIAKVIAELTPLQKEMLAHEIILRKQQQAVGNLDQASGQLEKSVSNLVNAFRDLDRQSVINQKLIETRSKYLSTRGGPMRQKAPSVDIDVATTAQYSPHELLYNRNKQYKSTVTEYLKTAEGLKAARSKIEEITKIEGKAEYMRSQGTSEEEISRITDKALITGSMESALMVDEQQTTNAWLETISNNIKGIPEKEGEEPGVTGAAGEGKGEYRTLEKIKKDLNIKAQYAEQENIEQAEYLRAKQIEKKTALDIAAGRGRTQDQVNREESEWLTATGYVPEEVKDRNKKLVQVHKEEKASREEWERAKQENLKPLQQSAGGMQSLVDSIRSGVTGIKGARNIRPLERDFSEWAERQGTGETAQERVADKSMQFDLAKSLYSQNLNLRAQGADTGVAPRRLYDIMEKASKGEDVTEDLEHIQKSLTEKKKEREEQIRKIQAEEYARAVKEVMTPHDEKLGSIKDNTDKLNTTMGDVGHSIVDAINATGKAQAVTTAISGDLSKMAAGDVRAAENINKPIITFPEEGESMSDFTARMDEERRIKKTKDAYSAGLRITPVSDEAKEVYGDTEALPERIKEKFFDRAKQKGEEYGGDRIVGFKDAIGTNVPARIPEMPSMLEVRKIAEEEKREPLTLSVQEGITMQKHAGYADVAESDAQFYENIMKGMPKKEEPVISTIVAAEQLVTDKEKAITMADEVNQMTKVPIPPKDYSEEKPEKDWLVSRETKDISVDKQKEFEESELKQKTKKDTKVGAEQIKETKDVNDEMSDLTDEILTLKTSVSDVNKLFEKLSKGLDDVSELGDKSKDSAALIETLGKSASDASSSLGTLSTKMDNVKSPETGAEPTMLAEEGHKYISEDSDIITELVNKTDGLVTSINSIEQNMLELSEGLVTTDSFADFKNEISGHFEEISELKTSVEDLNKDMILNNDYTVESKKQFEIIIDRLQTYDTAFTKIEENISFMDHKFTDAIAELHEMVVEAKDQAWAAYNFASQAINQI